VFPTASHPERTPLGLSGLADIAALGLPVVAIGGITPERVAAVRAAGAYGVAAIRGLWDALEPDTAAQQVLEKLTA
jgi:thiamine monophosphate synthase